MANRNPLVLNGGQLEALQPADNLDVASLSVNGTPITTNGLATDTNANSWGGTGALSRRANNGIDTFGTIITGGSYNITAGLAPLVSTPSIASFGGSSMMLIAPDGNNVYVTTVGGISNVPAPIYQYSRNTSTGSLTRLADSADDAGGGAYRSTITADGKSVYTSDFFDGTVSQFSRNTSTGILTALTPPNLALAFGVAGIVSSTDNKFVYVVNQYAFNITQFSRNTSTGLLTSLGNIATNTNYSSYLAIAPDGKTIYIPVGFGYDQYTRDTSSGLLTYSTSGVTADQLSAITISPDNAFAYALKSNAPKIYLYSRNTSTGNLTPISNIDYADGGWYFDLKISSDGTVAYVADYNIFVVKTFSRNVGTGALTFVSNTPTTIGGLNQIIISPDNSFVYAKDEGDALISEYKTSATLFTNVPLTNVSSAGASATANITVAGGAVTNVAVNLPGNNYAPSDVLSALRANLGGGSADFQIPVNSVYTTLSNTAIGHSALYLTISSFNSALGDSALQNNIGTNNVAVGQASLLAKTTGDYNVAIGSNALGNLLTGIQNTAIGPQAGTALTGAESYNVIIGNAAGTLGMNNNIIISDGQGNKCITADASGAVPIISMQGLTELKSYVKGSLPSATAVGQVIYVSDSTSTGGTGAICFARATGTASWIDVTTGLAVV